MKVFQKVFILVILLSIAEPLLAKMLWQQPAEKVKSLLQQAEEYENPSIQLNYLREAYKSIYELEDSLEANLYFQLGVAYGKLYKIDSSVYFLNQALNLAKKISDNLLEMGALNGLGNLARIENDNEQAMQYFITALAISENNENEEYINWSAKLLGNLAGIYFDLKEFDKALTYSKEALSLSQKVENTQSIAYSYSRLSYLYSAMDSVQLSLDNSFQSLVYFRQAKDSLGLVYQYYSLGTGYYKLNKLVKSKVNFEQAILLAEKFTEAETLAGSFNYLGLIALEQNQILAAKNYARNALRTSEKHLLLTHLRSSYDLLYKIALEQQEYEQALGLRNVYYQLSDSINDQEAIVQINELNSKYESEKKELEIAQLSYQNKLAKSAASTSNSIKNVVVVAAIIVILFIVYIYFLSKKQFKLKEELLTEEIDNLRLKIASTIQDTSELELSFASLNNTLVSPLSDREYEVLELTFSDKSNSQIADQLFVSVNTVKTHLKNIFEKLGVNNRKEAQSKVLNNI